MINFTRRSFLGLVGSALASVRTFRSMLASPLAVLYEAGAEQVRRLLGRQVEYRIETHFGAIVIYSSRAVPEGSLSNTALRDVTVELPTQVLLHFENDPALSGSYIDQRLAIANVDIVIDGGQLKRGNLRPLRKMTLRMPATRWFAQAADVSPLFLSFQPDDLTISISPDPLSDLSIAHTQWPGFNLSVYCAISSLVKTKTLCRNLRFVRKGTTLVANGLKNSDETAEIKVFKTLMKEDVGLIVEQGAALFQLMWNPEKSSLSLELSDLTTILRTHGSPQVDVKLPVPSLLIIQFYPAVLRLGSLEHTIYGFPSSHVESLDLSCRIELNGLEPRLGDNPLWRLMPAGSDIPQLSATIQVRPDGENDLLHAGTRLNRSVFEGKKRKNTEWIHSQELSSFRVRLRGLGAAAFRDPVFSFEGGLSRISQSTSGRAEFSTCEGKTIVGKYLRLGDYCFRLGRIDESHLFWTQLLKSGSPDSLEFVFDLAGATWPGHLDLRASELGGWVHLDRTDGNTYLDPSTDDLTDFRGKDFEVCGQVVWSYENGNHDWRLDDPRAITNPVRFQPLLVSLAQESFRSALEPSFPNTRSKTLLLPPFSLREHPEKTSGGIYNFEDPNMPGFESLNMWEPFVQTVLKVTHSITETFTRFASSDETLPVKFVNAGLVGRGSLTTPAQTTWAAQKKIEGLVPFRPIHVTSLTATPAEDLVSPDQGKNPGNEPCHNDLRTGFAHGLNDSHKKDVENSISRPSVLIAVSPIGGSIDFDWAIPFSQDLSGLGLHTYLHRYQNNYAVQQRLMAPWGLKIEITTKLFRNEDGLIRYCQLWRFLQESQTYGADYPVKIFSLRPLNPTTWTDGSPFLFKADFELCSDKTHPYKRDVNLQGVAFPFYCTTGSPLDLDSSAVVPFDDVSNLGKPTTIFDETTIILKSIKWEGNSSSARTDATVEVTASGEVLHSDGIALDDKSATVTFKGKASKENGSWLSPGSVTPVFKGSRITIGPGLLRILPPSQGGAGPVDYPTREKDMSAALPDAKASKNEINDSGTVTVDYSVTREVKLRDVQFLQLFFSSVAKLKQKEYDDAKAALTLKYTFNYQKDSAGTLQMIGTDLSTSCSFPKLGAVTEEVCDQDTQFTLTSHPKSFSCEITKKHDSDLTQNTTFVTDIGVPGVLVLNDVKFTVTGLGQTAVEFGDVELCPGLFTAILNDVISKWNLLGSGETFKFLVFWDKRGPGVYLSLDPGLTKMGGGKLDNLKIEARIAFNLDFSSGGSRSIALVINLGNGRAHNFQDIDWPNAPMASFGHEFLKQIAPVTLFIEPYDFKFTMALGFRARTVGQDLDLETFVCIDAEAGFGFGFSGVAKGSATLNLALRWCPTLKDGLLQCVDVLAIGVIIDAEAVVLGLINIVLHAEIFATLLLSCSPPNRMIAHVEFSGYASIKIAFVKIEAHFTVSLDKILGLDPCRHDCVGAIDERDRELVATTLSDHASRCVTAFANSWSA